MDGQTRHANREPGGAGVPAIDPAAWYADDMLKTKEWIYTLSDAEIGDLMNAVTGAEARGIDIKDLSQENFPLPVFGPVLGNIYRELTEGRGFVLIRGLPVAEITRAQAGAAFYGMGTYLGRAVSQNPMGHVLGEGEIHAVYIEDTYHSGIQIFDNLIKAAKNTDYVKQNFSPIRTITRDNIHSDSVQILIQSLTEIED